ncbi:GNAT family N-acetyltransferase [uncultured Sulfitobacter sp.]|uniref:GNAT family N-acetyltransferase n=1 Tax=uncultured Sulfitobacter sp. TaxID=191468 RepID=UPI0026385B1F|nr:GNAT family N-acetyltransferase [uncultured Sulfitobacter sp.]
MSLIFRPAAPTDKWDVHAWRNTEKVRQAMLTQHEITADEHDAWWDRKMVDPAFRMMLLEEDGVVKAVQIYFDIIDNGSAWWAFYFTPHAPEDMGPMMQFWKATELAGLSYAFDHLNRERLIIEVLRSNAGVLNWHKRFGFKPCDPAVSDNADDFDLEVMDYQQDAYAAMRDGRWAKDLAGIDIKP